MGGIELPEDEWNKIIAEADTNGDGMVRYFEMKGSTHSFVV